MGRPARGDRDRRRRRGERVRDAAGEAPRPPGDRDRLRRRLFPPRLGLFRDTLRSARTLG